MAMQTEFSIIPTQDELDRIDRQFGFRPVESSNPRLLTRQQIERYNRDGCLMPLDAFDAEQIAEHRRYFDRLLERVLAAGGDSYSISSAHLKYGRVYDLLTHPRIVAYVRDLLGPNVVGWGSHYFCKMPRDGRAVAWHQDASYWPLTPTNTVTVWLAIDDVDRENGCMRVIPGSHRHGHLLYRRSGTDEGNVLDQTIDDVDRFGSPVDAVLAAGQISIHSDLLLHGSEANNSDRRRCGLTLRYSSADVQAHLKWNQKGVIVSGAADPALWPGARRPQDD